MDNAQLTIELASFQGPFDLLLHLIKQMEVDINDIPMTDITLQYMNYIEAMQELELDIIGDYLVMAATLLEIKSNMLLPVEPVPDFDEDYEPDDPRDILVQQLLLYQQFQSVASELETKQTNRGKLYTRPMANLSHLQAFIPLEEGALTLEDLPLAMANIIDKMAKRQPIEREIHQENLSVSNQMAKILAAFDFDTDTEVSLDDFIEQGSRGEIVTTFLAMLELVRKQHLLFVQENKDAPIRMRKIGENHGVYD